MNEEMNRREAKLDEHTLEGVSGGGFGFYPPATADLLCQQCHHRESCGHHKDLVAYLQKIGYDNISSPSKCPFYNS